MRLNRNMLLIMVWWWLKWFVMSFVYVLLMFILISFVVMVGVNVLCVIFYLWISMGIVKLISWLLNLLSMIVSVVSSIM